LAKFQKIFSKLIKVLGYLLLSIFILLVVLILLIRSPVGQNFIVQKVTTYVSDKTGTTVSIERLFVTFRGDLYLEGLYVEDAQGDTLLYSKSLETGVNLLPLIRTGEIQVTRLEWEGLRANVHRNADGEFNFDFILEAFLNSEGTDPESETLEEGTQEEMPSIRIGPVRWKDFRFIYLDEQMGIDANLKLGSLELDLGNLDLEQMAFHVKRLDWSDTEVSYLQSKPFDSEPDTTPSSSPMPLLVVDELILSGIMVNYHSEPDSMEAIVNIGEFLLNLPEANLDEQNVMLKTLSLSESSIDIKMVLDDGKADEPSAESTEEGEFIWPDWRIEVGNVNLENNSIAYSLNNQQPREGYFNPEAIGLEYFNLSISNTFLKEGQMGMRLEEFSFSESSGFRLDELTFGFRLSDEDARLEDLIISTNHNRVAGNIGLSYASLEAFLSDPQGVNFNLNLPEIRFDVKDAYFFAPELGEDPYLNAFAAYPLLGNLEARGSANDLRLENLLLEWGQHTKLQTIGRFTQVMDPEKLFADIERFTFESKEEDYAPLLAAAEVETQLPAAVQLNATAKGGMHELQAQVDLEVPEGKIAASGNFTQMERIAFGLILEVDDLKLGELLDNPQLGVLAFRLEAEGEGRGLEDIDAYLSSEFRQLELNRYDYAGLKLEGEMHNSEGQVKLAFQDENLDVDLISDLHLDSLSSRVALIMDLRGADLLALNLSPNDLRPRFKLEAAFEGNLEDFEVEATLEDGLVVFDERPYSIGEFSLIAKSAQDTTAFELFSPIVDATLQSNSSIEETVVGLERFFNHYLLDTGNVDSVSNPVKVDLLVAIRETQFLSEVVLPGLNRLDSATLTFDFDEAAGTVEGRLDFPFLDYAGINLDSVGMRLRADEEGFRFGFGLVSLESGPIAIGRTFFTGELQEERVYVDFNAYDGEERLAHVNFDVGFVGDTVTIHIIPEDLVFNRRDWQIPDSNEVRIADQLLEFHDFIWTRNTQEFEITHQVQDIGDPHIGLRFADFRLATFTSILNPEDPLASGFMDGQVIIENPFGATGILADLGIRELSVFEVPLGNLSLEAESIGENDYLFALALKEGGIDLDLEGEFQADEEGAQLNLDLALNEVRMETLAGLSQDNLRDGDGYISGDIQVRGTTSDPTYEGTLRFNGAAFTVAELNSRFRLSEEVIRVDNEGVYLQKFTISDQDDNTFVLDGNIGTEDLGNPTFDLSLNASNFRVLNSTREDNDLFYGQAAIDAKVSISGDLNLPIVDGRLRVKSGTELTFIVPESQLDLIERDGVVRFVNRQDPDDILTRRATDQTTSGVTGYQVAAILEVDPNAVFRVVVDERSGDNLMISGEGNLNLNLDPNGRITLSGTYELRKGHYEMSLYNLVSRRFEIQEGSSIQWAGDPLDANLNLTAIYRVRTSAAELVASQAGGGDGGAFRQELPFLVYLNIDGELVRPEISFELDMPEESRGAAGGNVYGKIQQLNNQEGELNRQVFSLLVLNRFFPDRGGDGAGGGTGALARSSVSQVLSGQLNNLSENLLGDSGVELDFDMDSFTDYQTGAPQDRTQLNVSARTRFMDDRLIVQVGSQIDIEGGSQQMDRGNALLGNVSIEYLLTENGRYRLRGFRRNSFESFIDGQLVVTGMSLIFNREFNHFRELWRGIEMERNDRTRNAARKEEEEEQIEEEEEEVESPEDDNR
jgi:translocation and assembly module TamB